jgi:hypothetical protein
MPTNAERLYDRLNTVAAIMELTGQTEDSDFDCKQWFPQKSARESVAKGACGFANATGGVIVIGMEAKAGQDGVDVVQAEKPVSDAEAVRSNVLDSIAKLVEPGIEGLQSKSILLAPGSKEGFVIVFIPESEGPPHRSKADWRFYVRIASGTIPMEYFQIEDRFGRRPHARLVAAVVVGPIQGKPMGGELERIIQVTLRNEGRGLARFPAVRFERLSGVAIPANELYVGPQSIWPVLGDQEWISFRGGANDVVYPGETLKLATLSQVGQRADRPGPQIFRAVTIVTEVVCDGMPAHRQSFGIEEDKA